MRESKFFLALAFISLFLFSCKDNQHFKVIGTIENNSDGKTLYLEHVGMDRTDILDSVQLKNNGHYYFKVQRPVNPDFYRIRIDKNFIVFSVDSTETITITSKDPCFCIDYTIKGSESINKISRLRKSAKNVENKMEEYNKVFNRDSSNEEIQASQDSLNKALERHKEMAQRIILEDTRSPAAYYAVFQKINNLYLFDAYNSEDLKFYNAVATAYNVYYPHSPRGKHLVNFVLQTKRIKRSQEWKNMLMENATGIIDINLPNVNGENVRLSDLKGKVVLIDFCYLGTEHSIEHVYTMREIYQKYQNRGFEIYSISFDGDRDFFKSSSKTLPWIRVFDENGLQSDLLRSYNISELPTLFLVDKENNVFSRHSYVDEELLRNIEKLLSK